MSSFQPIRNCGLFGSLWCDAADGDYSPNVHPHETRFVKEECSNHRNRCHTCKTLNSELLKEVGGLELETTSLFTPEHFPTNYIPVVTKDFLYKNFDDIPFEYVGIPLVVLQWLFNAGTPILPACLSDKKVIVFLTGTDTNIEYFIWEQQRKLIPFLAALNVVAVVGPNYSVFEGWCPVGQQYNIKRSLHYSVLLSQLAIPTIPHVYTINEYQTERLIGYLNTHPEVTMVAINCQMQKKDFDRSILYEQVLALSLVPTLEKIILEGAWMTDLKERCVPKSKIILANKLPFYYARSGSKISVSNTCGIDREKGLDAGTPEAFYDLTMSNLENVQKFMNLCIC